MSDSTLFVECFHIRIHYLALTITTLVIPPYSLLHNIIKGDSVSEVTSINLEVLILKLNDFGILLENRERLIVRWNALCLLKYAL